MTTAATTPNAAGTNLALDLGKYKSVACAYDLATRAGAWHRATEQARSLGCWGGRSRNDRPPNVAV
jgi:hypothetical protein